MLCHDGYQAPLPFPPVGLSANCPDDQLLHSSRWGQFKDVVGKDDRAIVNMINNVSSQQKSSLHNGWNKIQGLQPETWQPHTQKILPASQQQPPLLPQVTTKVHPGSAAHTDCP